MNNSRPDFYLASDEIRPPFEPKACYFMDRISAVGGRDDYMLVTIYPPIQGRYGEDDIDEVILAAHHAGQTLFPISEYPMYVYVCHMKIPEIKTFKKADAKSLEIMFWGQLYRDLDVAKEVSS